MKRWYIRGLFVEDAKGSASGRDGVWKYGWKLER